MGGKYAENTEVPAEKSRAEIERTLARYGASAFASGWKGSVATIAFEAQGRRVRFELRMPDRNSDEIVKFEKGGWKEASKALQEQRYEQAVRQKWRALALAIKAKLEVVQSEISSFEGEFMAHIVLPTGQTVGQWLQPQLQGAYSNGRMPPLLTAGG